MEVEAKLLMNTKEWVWPMKTYEVSFQDPNVLYYSEFGAARAREWAWDIDPERDLR